MADPVLNQHTFGFFQDDSSDPDTCTQIGADNSTTEEIGFDTNFMVRAGFDETAGKSSATNFGLEYQINGTGGAWSAITGSGNPNINLADGTPANAAACDTQLLDSGASGSWQDGAYYDTSETYNITVNKDIYTELQWCVKCPSGGLTSGDKVYFRMAYNSGDAITMAYAVYPQITVISSGPAASIAFLPRNKRVNLLHMLGR